VSIPATDSPEEDAALAPKTNRAGVVRIPHVGREDFVLYSGVLLVAVVLGRSIAQGQIAFAGLVAGVALVAALTQAAWLPYVASAAVVGTFAEPYSLPQFGVPGNPFLSDLVLFAAFAAWLVVLSRADVLGPGSFPLAPQLAMAGLLLSGLVGVAIGIGNGIAHVDALSQTREIAFYATFWLALTAFANEHARALLLRLAAAIAVVIVVAQVAQGILGPGTLLFRSNDPLRELITCSSDNCSDPTAGFPRIRPPGLPIVYVAACFAAAYLLFGPRRRRGLVSTLLGVCLVGLLVSLNRNMLIGLIIGLALAGLLAARRGRFAATLTIAGLVLIMVLSAARSSPALGGSAIAERVLSLSSVSELESSSTVRDRERENGFALDALSRAPIEGLGWGVPYGMVSTTYSDGELRTEEPLFIHNQYLGVWLRTGLLGLASLIAALVLSVVYGTRWLREREDEDAWLGAGVIAGVTALALSSLVGIYVLNPASAPVLAGLVAFATVLRKDLGPHRVSTS
jgi:O-antigen ligase